MTNGSPRLEAAVRVYTRGVQVGKPNSVFSPRLRVDRREEVVDVLAEQDGRDKLIAVAQATITPVG